MTTPTPTARFRPHERIKDPATFRRAFERRRWESDATLTIYGVENGLDHPRLGISVSRKKIKTAAGRNRVKRLIREAFRLSKPELPAGLDLIVVPRNPSARFAEVRRSLPALARALERRFRGRKPREGGTSP
jgi:ribonuclease P protein component